MEGKRKKRLLQSLDIYLKCQIALLPQQQAEGLFLFFKYKKFIQKQKVKIEEIFINTEMIAIVKKQALKLKIQI